MIIADILIPSLQEQFRQDSIHTRKHEKLCDENENSSRRMYIANVS